MIYVQHDGFRQALQLAYPELSFTKWKGRHVRQSKWVDRRLCQKFFEDFAKKNGFDPADHAAWDNVTSQQLLKEKVCHAFLLEKSHTTA